MTDLHAQVARLEARVAALEKLKDSATNVQMIRFEKEYDRVLQKMETIRGTYAGHQSWTKSDLAEFGKLRHRQLELRSILGIKY